MPITNVPFEQVNPAPGDFTNAVSHSTQHTEVNDELTAVEESLRDGWVRESAAIARLSDDQFTVAGDVTAYYTAGRQVVFNLGSGSYGATVSSSSYSGGTLLTTVSIDDIFTIPDPISSVGLSVQMKGQTQLSTEGYGDGSVTGRKIDAEDRLHSGVLMQYAGATAPDGWLLADGSAVSRTDYEDLFTAIGVTYGIGDGSTTFNVPNLKGRVVVGLDGADTAFDALGETGGTATHTHTATTDSSGAHTHTVASHTHTGPSHTHTGPSHTHSGPSHTHSISSDGSHNHDSAGGGSFLPGGATAFTANGAGHNDTSSNGSHSHGGSTGSSGTGETGASGTGSTGASGTGATGAASPATDSQGAHTHTLTTATGSSLQPYIVLNYIIKT